MWVHRLLGETGAYVVEDNPESSRNGEATEITEPAAGVETNEAPAPAEEIVNHSQNENTRNEENGQDVLYNANITNEKEPIENREQEEEKTVTETAAEPLAFEPYHTVDYFASQGIKYKPEDKPQDKLGQQLKSFTDWLKTMKRLPVSEIAAKTEPASEKKVEQLAERSLQEKDVLTEAMAEVWIKQGNRDKARDIYKKLSLQDPSKRAYFAAKIEDLQK